MVRIGIIYRELAPQFLSGSDSPPMRWSLEFFDEGKLFSGPVPRRPDFLAVFCPAGHENPELPGRVAMLFPGAELISYLPVGRSFAASVAETSYGLPAVHLPMSLPAAARLFDTLAAARDNERAVVSLKKRVSEMEELFGAFVSVVEGTYRGTDRKLDISLLLDKIRARVDAEECVIYFTEPNDDALQRGYSTGYIRDIDLFEYHANNSIVEKVLHSGEAYLDNHHSFEIEVPFSKESLVIRSILCVPLLHGSEKFGVIEILNKKGGRGFTSEDKELIQSLAKPLGVAVKNILAFESSERLIITDDLTKLYNYRYLLKYLQAEIKRCLRYKKKVSLLFIDVDGFKQINDTFGHLVGSQALAEMGQMFRRILRDTDVAARYGGDEFVIVLPETTLAGAVVIAERIRKQVEEFEFAAQNLSIKLTVSLGVANSPKHSLTAEGLIKKADVAMYKAKELSRNSIKVAV